MSDEPLSDEICDRLVAMVMDKLAAKASDENGTVHALDLNPNIMTHHSLRRSIVRTAHMLGAASAPSPSVGADGLPTDLWALIRAYGDCRADAAVNSRDVSAAQYLKLAESNLRDALAALASRPVGDGGADDDVTLLAAIAAAVPVMRAYARQNPPHEYRGVMQDPYGVHAWLASHDPAARTAGTDTAGGV